MAQLGTGDVLLTSEISGAGVSNHHLGPTVVRTKVRIAPDQTVVLAQSGFDPGDATEHAAAGEPAQGLYYLVRATVRNEPPAHP
jgi:hypothetical protein